MPTITEAEQHAIVTDAAQRLAELEAVRDVLLPDAADPAVAAELAQIASQIKTAVAALDNDQSHPVASTAQPTHAAGLIQAYDDRALSHSRPHAPPQAPPPGTGGGRSVGAPAFTLAMKDFPPRRKKAVNGGCRGDA